MWHWPRLQPGLYHGDRHVLKDMLGKEKALFNKSESKASQLGKKTTMEGRVSSIMSKGNSAL